MSRSIISVEQLGKQYRLGAAADGHISLRETLNNIVKKPFSPFVRKWRTPARKKELFWALKDIAFDVQAGEVIGIIGRNGSGKSTLLKILSRITEPTLGQAVIRGRVGSLLEVGTGFHQELTGRENIFLNGAILGMKNAEIQKRFDEIVAFADVEKFLDTPVKHYSSGMYLRLAFSVAAHLESEILVVDEVLAVGDTSFQKKCLGRMGEVSRSGRTVLFVSHSMPAVQQLTNRAVVLHLGKLDFVGDTPTAVQHYLQNVSDWNTDVYEIGKSGRRLPGYSRTIEFLRFQLQDHSNKMLQADQDVVIWVTLKGNEDVKAFRLSTTIYAADGTPVGGCFGPENLSIRAGTTAKFEFRLHDLHLAPGAYYCGMGVGTGNQIRGFLDYDVVLDVIHFEILATEAGAGTKSYWSPTWGCIRFPEAITGELNVASSE
jgi:lipopolysaccharide transport system ATP-binding protein